MSDLYNISSSPHFRSKLTTDKAMYEVLIALLPVTVTGIIHFGVRALVVILISVATALLTEYIFEKITKRPNTLRDGSAAVTGLLLALCLSPAVPWYVPLAGAFFAVFIVKCLFGGLGRNFMNPALAGRCFLLASFSSAMTNYAVDGVSSATPLAEAAEGNPVNIFSLFCGTGTTSGVIGCSILALLIGGIFLLVVGGITWEIPAATLASFALFIVLFGGHGLDISNLMTQLFGGGIVMAAFFMATDPVTSPVSTSGQLLYGALAGILAGLFRVRGSSADSVSYAIILANLFTPLIDIYVVPKPRAYRKKEKKEGGLSAKALLPALTLCLITLIAGIALSSAYDVTKDAIAEQEEAKKLAAYQAVLPDAVTFETVAAADEAIAALDGGVYGTDFGNVTINEVMAGEDSSGEVVGYGVSVTSGDGYGGDITLTVGISTDGTIYGIEFTELAETAGMGMRASEPEFKDQFNGRKVEKFILNKSGGSTSDDEIDSISGASITSSAVVNAVNAALDFFANYLGNAG